MRTGVVGTMVDSYPFIGKSRKIKRKRGGKGISESEKRGWKEG